MRLLLLASLLVTLGAVAHADVPRHPDDSRPRPERPSPPPPKPAPSGKACGTGAAIALFGICVYGAWRLSKGRTAAPHEAVA